MPVKKTGMLHLVSETGIFLTRERLLNEKIRENRKFFSKAL